ncbi:MAG TPA: HD domain-containing phosphohydrolase, partial [Acidimicrobiales bacterium]|nr:HD domain-containing phosphohydrolase [Acidimicrobiales bacterium]
VVTAPERDRLASLFGALVSSADVASGFHPEKAIRTAILATRLTRAHGLDDAQQQDAYYLALVRFLGCTSFSPEAAQYGGGDDLSVHSVMSFVDPDEPVQLIGDVLRGVGRGAPSVDRVKGLVSLFGDRSAPLRHAQAECDIGEALARHLGISEPIVLALGDLFERWDGKGFPSGKKGDESALLARVVIVAEVLEIAFSRYGIGAAVETARKRSGGRFDPAMASTFCRHAPELLAGLTTGSVWELFLESEPEPHCQVTPALVERYAEAFARAVDLKSVWTATHSYDVGILAAASAQVAGLDQSSVRELRTAGWLHDLGRVAVPNLIWDKPGPLNEAEREQVRLHAYQTERLLARSPVLAPAAALAGAVHERCDGPGYPKSLKSAQLDEPARLLAACDVFCALREDRPHRAAYKLDVAASMLTGEARRGALDPAAARHVLEAAEAAPPRLPGAWPSGLSDREVEVLRLVARGGTNKDVARALGISSRTVQHHVAHIYTKIGVTSRAGAALFAAEHGLTAGSR